MLRLAANVDKLVDPAAADEAAEDHHLDVDGLVVPAAADKAEVAVDAGELAPAAISRNHSEVEPAVTKHCTFSKSSNTLAVAMRGRRR